MSRKEKLVAYLTDIFGKEFSTTNLKQMRQFYLIYVNDQISQTLSDQFETLSTVSTGRKFFLSRSHYLKLMRIDNIDERHFTKFQADAARAVIDAFAGKHLSKPCLN